MIIMWTLREGDRKTVLGKSEYCRPREKSVTGPDTEQACTLLEGRKGPRGNPLEKRTQIIQTIGGLGMDSTLDLRAMGNSSTVESTTAGLQIYVSNLD